MASSLARPSRTPRNEGGGPSSGTLHPVLADYQAALERGDERALQAQQLLSANDPRQLQRIALSMLQQRGLSLDTFLKRLGLR